MFYHVTIVVEQQLHASQLGKCYTECAIRLQMLICAKPWLANEKKVAFTVFYRGRAVLIVEQLHLHFDVKFVEIYQVLQVFLCILWLRKSCLLYYSPQNEVGEGEEGILESGCPCVTPLSRRYLPNH